MSPSKDTKVDSETAVAILTKKADLARAQIRGLVNSLPDSEAESILDVLDNPPEDSEQPEDFVWDKLPAEVKNIIYRFVFVADTPIKPHIMWPNVPHRRQISKYNLGANFLRCSKAIYEEARPILRMENTFEIGTQFRVSLGEDKDRRNSSLIRKVLIRPEKFSWTIWSTLARLENKDELILADDFAWRICNSPAEAESSAAMAFAAANRRISRLLSVPWFLNRFSKVYYVAERHLEVSATTIQSYGQVLTHTRAEARKERIVLHFDFLSNTVQDLTRTAWLKTPKIFGLSATLISRFWRGTSTTDGSGPTIPRSSPVGRRRGDEDSPVRV